MIDFSHAFTKAWHSIKQDARAKRSILFDQRSIAPMTTLQSLQHKKTLHTKELANVTKRVNILTEMLGAIDVIIALMIKKTSDAGAKIDLERPYKYHRAGSCKGQVHQMYDQRGKAAAFRFGVGLGKQPRTVEAWMGRWKNNTDRQ